MNALIIDIIIIVIVILTRKLGRVFFTNVRSHCPREIVLSPSLLKRSRAYAIEEWRFLTEIFLGEDKRKMWFDEADSQEERLVAIVCVVPQKLDSEVSNVHIPKLRVRGVDRSVGCFVPLEYIARETHTVSI